MKNSKELKQLRASNLDAQVAIQTTAAARADGAKEWTSEEETRFDALQTEIEALDAQIVRSVKFENNQAARSAAGETVGAPMVSTPKKLEPFSFMRALRSLANGKEMHAADRAVHDASVAELRNQGLSTPEGNFISLPMAEIRAQSVSDNAGAKGGALVASTPQLVRPLQPVISIASMGVNILSGLVGDVPLPTSGTFSFSYLAETAGTVDSDVNFSGPTLKPKRCAGSVLISRKLLAQTSFNIEQYIINQINIAYGNAIVSAALNGPGGDAPTGLYSLITSNINLTATAPTHAIIVDLESKIDAADSTSVNRYYLSDTKLRAKTKTTPIDAGSGLFLSDGKELNGYGFKTTTLMPVLDMGVSHPLIFGDWSQLFIGTWGNISIMVDPYTKASNGQVKLIIEGFSDVALTNEKAFAIANKLTV